MLIVGIVQAEFTNNKVLEEEMHSNSIWAKYFTHSDTTSRWLKILWDFKVHWIFLLFWIHNAVNYKTCTHAWSCLIKNAILWHIPPIWTATCTQLNKTVIHKPTPSHTLCYLNMIVTKTICLHYVPPGSSSLNPGTFLLFPFLLYTYIPFK